MHIFKFTFPIRSDPLKAAISITGIQDPNLQETISDTIPGYKLKVTMYTKLIASI